jgi:hypothetical protein
VGDAHSVSTPVWLFWGLDLQRSFTLTQCTDSQR